jgi:hypothetical protein
MKADQNGLVLRIGRDGNASVDGAKRSGRELHRKTRALSRRERNRKCQAGDAKARPADCGLANACTARTNIRNRRDLCAAAAYSSSVHREATGGDRDLSSAKLRVWLGNTNASGNAP